MSKHLFKIGDHVEHLQGDSLFNTGTITNDRDGYSDAVTVRVRWDHQLDSETWVDPVWLAHTERYTVPVVRVGRK